MAATNPNVFTWQDIEILPDMHRLEMVLHYLPDDAFVKALVTKRGCGRNEYPIAAMWNAVVAGIVFQHQSVEALIRETRRNPALLRICGFDSLATQSKPVTRYCRDESSGCMEIVSIPAKLRDTIPNGWNFSRFLNNLIELQGLQCRSRT